MENIEKKTATAEATESVSTPKTHRNEEGGHHVFTHVTNPETLFKCLDKLAELESAKHAATIEIPMAYFEELIKARTERDVVKTLAYTLASYNSGDAIKQVFAAVDGKGLDEEE